MKFRFWLANLFFRWTMKLLTYEQRLEMINNIKNMSVVGTKPLIRPELVAVATEKQPDRSVETPPRGSSFQSDYIPRN